MTGIESEALPQPTNSTALLNESDLPAEKSGQPIPSAIGRLAREIDKDVIGTGGVAELRRSFSGESLDPTFWKTFTKCVLNAGVDVTPDQESDWAMIIGGMAIMAPYHHGTKSFGQALADANYPEQRLQALLARDPGTEGFCSAMYTAVRWLTNNAEPANWISVAYLILSRDPESVVKHQRKIARDYYNASFRKAATE